VSTYTPPTLADRIRDRLDDNERLRKRTERSCRRMGRLTVRGAQVLSQLAEEREALAERLAEVEA
jgi:hypothetical protein